MSRGNYKTKVIKRCRCRSPTHYHCTQKLKCHKENILWLKFCNECCCCCRRLRSERSQGASTSGQESSWKGAQEARRRGSFQVVTCHDMTWHVMSRNVMLQVIRESRKHRDSHNTTLMLVIVIGLFLMTEIPLLVITVLHTLDNRCNILSFCLCLCFSLTTL